MAAPLITWDDVTAIAPELAAASLATQTAILATVGNQVPVDAWGDSVTDGQKYLAAHLGTLSARRGQGPLTAQSAGQLSQSYASMLQFGQLGSTAYGVEYQRLTGLLPTALGAVF